MRFSLLVVICLSFLTQGFSQRLDTFSVVPNDFMKELSTFVTSSKTKTMEEVFETFEKKVKEGVYTEEEMATIRDMSNRMLASRMTANPHFRDYLKGLSIIKNTEFGEMRFKNWHVMLNGILDRIEKGRNKSFSEFIEFSSDFFSSRALRSSQGGVNWYAYSDRFLMTFEGEEPVIKYESAKLVCSRKTDSVFIDNTSGVFYTTSGIWKGKGGRVNWSRFKGMEDVFADLNAYDVDTKSGLYEAKGSKLTYPLFFGNTIIEGDFTDKLITGQLNESSYPKFQSKESVLEIKNIGEGIRFVGGFKLEGTTVYGYGNTDAPAKIWISKGPKELFYHGEALNFIIRREERIVGERVASTLYFGQDSILHPSVNVRFDIPKRVLQLSRGDRGSDRNPFYSTFHQSNISAEKITAYVNRDTLFFGEKTLAIAKGNTPVSFESLSFFNEGDYRRYQNISSINPIAIMKITAEKTGERIMDANDLAKRLDPKFTVDNVRSLLYDLVADGFINYDAEKELVEIKDKIFLFAEASQGKVDYDALKIISRTDETNAVFSTKDGLIHVYGVPSLEFSEQQHVGAKPTDNNLILKKNRDLDFDGRLFAGNTVFSGKGFGFKYDNFLIDLDSMRFFDIYIPNGEIDKNNKPITVSIGSRIEHLSGVLLVDAPRNKSGKENIDLFPSVQSKGSSYVFYDYKNTQDSAYGRDSFFFELKPFSFNSLDKFVKSDIQFKGKLVSANIFPDFEETLVMQEDQSLGFKTKTPATGYPTYAKKGKYTGGISLSNVGLQGQGKLNYLGAVINSEDIIFKPKQLLASAEAFNLEERRTPKPEEPQVRGIDVKIDWRPYSDSMYVTSKEAPFELFKSGLHTLKGTLIYTPGGLKARGQFDWDKASMTSGLFSLGAFSAAADTLNLKIRAFGTSEIALQTDNLNGNVDFDTQIGVFKANDEYLNTVLPYNQYKTSMNEFVWNMKDENITFNTTEGKLGSFTSIHPDQDSLFFNGKTAFYDLKTNALSVGGIPHIVSADAYIYPDSNKVDIKVGGVIATLNNAKIVADTVTKYHVINRAVVDIKGRKDFTASGFYEYNIADKKQEIEFSDIIGARIGKGKASEKNVATRANGVVGAENMPDFYIDNKTLYRGTISLFSEKPNLTFEGFARLDAPKLLDPQWFSVNFEGDKNDLAISYSNPKNYEGDPVETGFFVHGETNFGYSRIMMTKYGRKDRAIIQPRGSFKYNKKEDYFVFGDSMRVANPNLRTGNILKFYNADGKIVSEGKLSICDSLKNISVAMAGNVTANFELLPFSDTLQVTPDQLTNIGKIAAESIAGINITLPDVLMKMMVADFKSSGFDALNINFARDQEFYKNALSEIFTSDQDLAKALNEIGLGSINLPKKINNYSMLFGKLPLRWEPDYQSFVSTESKLAVISMDGEMINKMISGYLEFKMPANGDDRLYIYLKSPGEFFYFFGYKQGIMNVASNNTKFNDTLLGLKEKDRLFKMKNGDIYEIQPINASTAEQFVNRIRAVNGN